MTREEYARSRSWILKVIRDRCELTRAETDYLNDLIEVIDQIPNLKDAYDKGYKDGQKALAVHLELCKEEGNCDYYDSYNQTCRRSDVPKEPCDDYISRQAVLCEIDKRFDLAKPFKQLIKSMPCVQPKPKTEWIPLKTRPMTEEETEHYFEYTDMRIDDTYTILDCPLPDDGQEVLISWGGIVCVDAFIKDCDGCYFEGVDIDDVEAWMPLPQPYEPHEKEVKE